ASNSYISLPAALGNASIESITASDESGKININYAPYNLMRRLLYHCGITPQSTANTLATNIVNYRTSNWFNTMEEIKQVTGMTDAYFDLIDQDITVYSWVNQDVMRPPDLPTDPPVPRASININTASLNVLKAVLKTATPGYDNDRINEIATAIKNQRDTQLPFTHMFSSYATQTNDTQSFAAFIEDLSVTDLTADRKNSMRNVADGSYYNRELSGDPNQNWFENDDAGGVEFCYYAHTFLIESTGRSGNIERTVIQTYGSTYNYSTYTFDSEGELVLPTYIGESSPKPYWREEH
ncbi:MAG: helix-hairpin-helix domain-containing protein, partial [Candidatus Omnitrophica bacterium]|nr:helix-hairpin-helix domain-containing protein [Candidatus Omnitrophota bacterium]